MADTETTNEQRTCTARELRRMPAEDRDRILAAQAELAVALYRDNPDLLEFEAFGEDDLHADSSNTEPE